jgi:hypothetical protein
MLKFPLCTELHGNLKSYSHTKALGAQRNTIYISALNAITEALLCAFVALCETKLSRCLCIDS